MIGIYIFVAAAASAIAFGAQWFLPPRRRTAIIFSAAAIPSALPIVAAVIAALAIGVDEPWFHVGVSVVFAFATLMFVGLAAAIVGSELASLARRLLRRQD